MEQQTKDVLTILARVEAQLKKIYGDTYKQAVEISEVRKAIESGDATFSWSRNPGAEKKLETLLSKMSTKSRTLIAKAMTEAEQKAETAATGQLEMAFGDGDDIKELCREAIDLKRTVASASRTGLNKSRGGFSPSSNVWKSDEQSRKELEAIIQKGIMEGKSADEVSRSIRQYLNEPDKLFRRVRDPETGEYRLSKAASEYHPGPGVYRSAYKNAMRLARTEITAAYRQSMWESWQNNPLVVGIEIRLSNNHTVEDSKTGERKTLYDVCDELAGVYPKTFRWTGWHPQCRCDLYPVLVSKADVKDIIKKRREARHAGKDPKEALKDWHSKREVDNMPDNFNDWIRRNSDRLAQHVANGKTPPYWVTDNFNSADIMRGLAKKLVQAAAAAQPGTVPDELKQDLEAAAKKIGVEVGEPMTFEEADELRGNPHYIQGSGNGYTVNCQSCVVANELRRRGLNVEAQQNTKRSGNIPNELSYKTEWAWIDPKTGGRPTKTVCYATPDGQRTGPRTVEDLIKNVEEAMKTPGRYHVDWVWGGRRSGHIITAERLPNGTLRFYDPQTGKLFAFRTRASEFNLADGVKVLRVDNLKINGTIVDGVVAKAGTTKSRTTAADVRFKHYLSTYKKLLKLYEDEQKVFDFWKKIGVPDDFIDEFKEYLASKSHRTKRGGVSGDVIAEQKKNSVEVLRQGREKIIGKLTYTNPAFGGKVAKFSKNSFTENLRYGSLFDVKSEILLNIESYLTPDLVFKFETASHGNNRGFYKAKTAYRGKIEKFKGRTIELQFAIRSSWELEFYYIKVL